MPDSQKDSRSGDGGKSQRSPGADKGAQRGGGSSLEHTGQQPAKRDAIPDEEEERELSRRKSAARGAPPPDPEASKDVLPNPAARVDRHFFDRSSR